MRRDMEKGDKQDGSDLQIDLPSDLQGDFQDDLQAARDSATEQEARQPSQAIRSTLSYTSPGVPKGLPAGDSGATPSVRDADTAGAGHMTAHGECKARNPDEGAGAHIGAGHMTAHGERMGKSPAHPAKLVLNFLGAKAARIEGTTVQLRLRFAELLTALALHPEGLTGEQLTLAVYGELGDCRRCRVELGRLRRVVPIQSRPYRLAAQVDADFLAVMSLIGRGEVERALALYQGPLLSCSEAPVVVETRSVVEASLRQAVLEREDADLLWLLAEQLRDDLEVWERLPTALGARDPRKAVACAHVRVLEAAYGV